MLKPLPEETASDLNLAHYIALRRHDIRELQEQLTANGLSSLGRGEAMPLRASVQSA
jgi:pyruvate kinase